MPGTYNVTISTANFATQEMDNVAVAANTVARVDAQLKVAAATQSVTVTTEAPILETDKADVHTDISRREVEGLPISSSQGRSFQSLYKLIPGTGLPTEANSAAGNPQRAISVNTNGQSIQTNNTRIDGATNSYPWLPQNIAYVPPADAVENVNIVTNSFDAEQGQAGGAAVSVQIKSGTSQFHGSLHEFHTDNALAARDYFFPKTTINPFTHATVPQRKALNIQHQFGGTIGGPIVKDKLFFFGDYERTLQRLVATSIQSVFSDADPNSPAYYKKLRSGDFSGISTKIFDPATGKPDGTGRSQISCNGVLNVICPNRIDSATAAFLQRVPAPNLTTTNGLSNYFAAEGAPCTRDTFDVKVNYVPGQNSTIFARYSFSRSTIFDPPVLGAAGGGAINGGPSGTAYGRIQSVGLGATHAFSPNLLLDWNFGFTRQHRSAENVDLKEGNVGLNQLHIPGTNGPTFLEGGIPFFQFATSTYSNMGNADTGNPFLFRDNQWVTNANLSWIKGRHSFRAGLYELPFGRNKRFAHRGIANALAGGWQLNRIFSHLSGLPFTVTANNNLNAPGSGTDSADVLGPIDIIGGNPGGGGTACAGNNLRCYYFDPTVFAAPPATRYGNTNRNFLRGPGFTNLDASVFRNFRLTERFTLQFRAEAFGVTNTPHFNTPNANVSGAFNSNGSVNPNSNFGTITGTIGGRSGTNLNGARTFWFAAKLMF